MESSIQFYSSYKYDKITDKEDIFELINRIESSNYDILKCESVLGSRKLFHSLAHSLTNALIGTVVSLAYNAMISNNTDLLADILDSKSCECIINCIKKYGVRSKTIALLSCLIVGILAYSSLELREYFGTLEVVVTILLIYLLSCLLCYR